MCRFCRNVEELDEQCLDAAGSHTTCSQKGLTTRFSQRIWRAGMRIWQEMPVLIHNGKLFVDEYWYLLVNRAVLGACRSVFMLWFRIAPALKGLQNEVLEKHMPSRYCSQTLFTGRYQYSSTAHSVKRHPLASNIVLLRLHRNFLCWYNYMAL